MAGSMMITWSLSSATMARPSGFLLAGAALAAWRRPHAELAEVLCD